MQFRHPTKAEKFEIENLWAYCFEPKGDPFFEFYFSECYKEEDTLIGKEIIHGKEKALAMVHLRPYKISVRNKAMNMAYIVGVATDPTARRSGIGREILIASLKELRSKGHALNILMPSMAGFYQQYGWELYCHQWLHKLPLADLKPLSDRNLEFALVDNSNEITYNEQIKDLMAIYEEYTSDVTGFAVRDEAHWRRLLKSVIKEGLHIAIAYNKETPVAYMFYKLGSPEIIVPEIAYSTRQGQKSLLGYIYNHRSQGDSIRWNEGLKDTGYIFYPNGQIGNEITPFMMSRVVDVEQAFKDVPVTANVEIKFTLKVSDPIASWNNDVFEIDIADGKVNVKQIEAEIKPDAQITVGALGLMFFGKMNAKQLSFEGKLQANNKLINTLTKAYPQMDTFINEWY